MLEHQTLRQEVGNNWCQAPPCGLPACGLSKRKLEHFLAAFLMVGGGTRRGFLRIGVRGIKHGPATRRGRGQDLIWSGGPVETMNPRISQFFPVWLSQVPASFANSVQFHRHSFTLHKVKFVRRSSEDGSWSICGICGRPGGLVTGNKCLLTWETWLLELSHGGPWTASQPARKWDK